MHELIIESTFDADVHSKIKIVSYSTSPREIVTIENAIVSWSRKEELSYMQMSITERREQLEKWIGKSVQGWSDKRVHAVFTKEYSKRLRVYQSIDWRK